MSAVTRFRDQDFIGARFECGVEVRNTLASLTEVQLATVTRVEPGWPQLADFPVKECLRIVLNEEWEHRLYAERDLTALDKEN